MDIKIFFHQKEDNKHEFNKGRDAALAPAEGIKSRVCSDA